MTYYAVYLVSFFGTKFVGLENTILALKKSGLFFRKMFSFNDSPENVSRKLGTTLNRVPLAIKCLDQAIASWFWLNINGHGAILRIGVNLTPLESHAWVALGDKIFVKAPNIPDLNIVAEYGPWCN